MAKRHAKTAVAYYRQSKARDDSISIDIQREQVLAYCARQGYEVVEEVVEEGVSAYRDWQKRPHFHRVLEATADVVVVYRWSRLSRRRKDQVMLISLLEEAGKIVESAVEPVDISTAGGRLSRDQMLLIAAFESDVKSEQWKEALSRRVSKGLPRNGARRFGYQKDGKAFVVDPVEGPILREMYLRYIAAAGFQGLVRELNERGVKTTRGGEWSVHSLIRALDSGFGAGLLIHERGQSFTEGAHEGVITPEEWAAYQQARDSRRQLPTKRQNPRWFLSGIVRCGLCGAPVIVNTYEDKKSLCVCSRYKNGRSCSGVWVKRQWVEQRIAVWVGGHVDQMPENAPERDEERARVETRVEALAESLEAIQERLGRLADGWASGLLDDEGYRRAQAGLIAERDDLTKQLVAARDEAERLTPIHGDMYNRLEIGDVTPGEWGSRLAKVIRRVEVYKDRLVVVPMVGESTTIRR